MVSLVQGEGAMGAAKVVAGAGATALAAVMAAQVVASTDLPFILKLCQQAQWFISCMPGNSLCSFAMIAADVMSLRVCIL